MTDLLHQPVPRRTLSISTVGGGRGWRHQLARNRYQLLGATLIGVGLPALVRSGLDFSLQGPGSLQNAVAATFLAMLTGAYLMRRMTAYPGVSTVAAVVPAFGAAYAVAIVLFFFARLDYSRFQFLTSFGLVVLWFGFVGLVEPRRRPRLLLLPFGKATDLVGSGEADWLVARSPSVLPEGLTAVVADLRADLSPEWSQLLAGAALAGLPVYHCKQISEAMSGTVDIEHISENNLGSLLPSSVYLRLKRQLDVAVAIVTLPATLAIGLLAVLAIWICDGRPIFFTQQRVGFRGRPFTLLKFRTMVPGGGEGCAYTQADDPRVTRLGRVLRRWRIDELPQVINILAGEMSWIGPRPESRELAEWYESEVPFYSYRHIIRPGITGWAQVNQGNVAEITAATGKLRYDFYYIKHFSPWLDLLVAARTLRTLLTGFGAR
ncbi:MAG: sugar transferase [Bauldia sp.]